MESFHPTERPLKDVDPGSMVMLQGNIIETFFKTIPQIGADPGYCRLVSLKSGDLFGVVSATQVMDLGKFGRLG